MKRLTIPLMLFVTMLLALNPWQSKGQDFDLEIDHIESYMDTIEYLLDDKYEEYYSLWGLQDTLFEEFMYYADDTSEEALAMLEALELELEGLDEDLEALEDELWELEDELWELEYILDEIEYANEFICNAEFDAHSFPEWDGEGTITTDFYPWEDLGDHTWTVDNSNATFEPIYDWENSVYVIFDEPGDYTVTHTVELFDTTCSFTAEIEVDYNGDIYEPDYDEEEYVDDCYIDFWNYTEDLYDPYNVTFEGVGGWYNDNEDINFTWDFGDGNTATGDIVEHTYDEEGEYTVTVAGSDLGDCNDVISWPIYVYDESEYLDNYDDEWYGDCDFSGIYGWVGTDEFHTIVTDVLVTLYAYDDESGQLIPIEEQFVSDAGWFEFETDPGMYAVYAQVMEESDYYGELFSGYFSEDETFDWIYESPETWTAHVSLNWEMAGIISIEDELDGTFLGIELLEASMDLNGDGEISGIITFDNEDGGKQEVPVAGATVMLLDEDGVPLTSVLTDENGYYEFTGLPYGAYKVWTEVWGHETSPIDVAVSEQQKVVSDVNVVVEDVDIVAALSVKKVTNIKNVSEVYPNPAMDNISLSVETKRSMNVNLSITNLVGQQLYSATQTLKAGQNIVSLDISNLPAGNYQVDLSDANGTNVASQQLSKME